MGSKDSKRTGAVPAQPERRVTGQLVLLTVVLILTLCAGTISQTALNAMFTGIATDFGVPLGLGQLVTTVYMLVLGITVPAITYLMRRFSEKALALIAIAILLAGGVLDLMAPTFPVLVAGRVLQAVSAGIMLPMMTSVVMIEFPPSKQATVMGVAGIALGFAPNIGPTIGGFLVMEAGWRSFFAGLTVLSLVLLLVCAAFVKPRGLNHPDAKLDLISFLLSSIGFGLLLVGTTNMSNMHPAHPLVWAPVVGGFVVLALFVRRQLVAKDPLMSMEVFKSKQYVAGFASLCLLNASFMGITLILPLFMEGVWGGTAFQAGLALLPGTITALALNPLSGIMTDKAGARPTVMAGSVCLALGAVSMVFLTEATPFWAILAMQLVRSAGVSLLMSPMTTWSMAKLPLSIMVDGSSASSAVRQVCASVGTALMVFAVTLGPAVGQVCAFQIAFGISAVLAVAVLAVNAATVR